MRLNANYMRIGWATPKDAFIAMWGGKNGDKPPALALDIHYEYDADGNPLLETMSFFDPLSYEDWLLCEVRKGQIFDHVTKAPIPMDKTIKTVRGPVRIPTVIVCPKYFEMPDKKLKPTSRGIRERDKNRCGYTGQLLTNSTFSLDHIIPRSKGGRDTWGNLIACHKDVNTKKGNKSNEEAGLKLLVRPYEPKSMPLCVFHNQVKHPDHKHF